MEDENEELSKENAEGDNDEIRELYKRYMSNLYSESPITGPWTQKWIDYMKKILWDHEHKIKLSKEDKKFFKKCLKNNYYFVDARGHGGSLRIRVPDSDNKLKALLVVAAEDAFDIIWKNHLKCNHGSVAETIKRIHDKYYIDIRCVECVIELCHICKEKKERITAIQPGFNRRATLEILDMSSTADGHYKYVLIYTDEFTGLVQLRAIKDGDELEMTFKLMHIFADLGLPKILSVHDARNYNNIIKNLNDIFCPCTINVCLKFLDNSKTEYIKNLLKEWTKREDTSHWQMGCYDVQWTINNLNTKGRIPQHVVFKTNTCENPPALQGDAKTAPLNESDIQISLPDQDIMFEEPSTANPNPKPINSNAKFGSILQNALVQPQQTGNKYDNVEPSMLKGKEMKSCKSPHIDRKVYVNKKVLVSKQDCLNNDQPDSSNTNVPIEPPLESTMTPVAFGSQNHTIDMSKTFPITVEHPKVPLKLEVMNYIPTCSVCIRDILYKSYTCMMCMTEIHMDCGKLVGGGAAEDQIVCISCETEVKKKKIE